MIVGKLRQNKTAAVFAACYALMALFCLARALVFLAYDAAAPEIIYTPDKISFEGIAPDETGENRYITLHGDPQFLLTAINEPVRRVLLRAEFQNSPGEMDLYPAEKTGQWYSPKNRAFGKPVEEGFEYILSPRSYASLRIDAGVLENNAIVLKDVVLNPKLPASAYFIPDLRAFMTFAIVPALASCLICTIMEIVVFSKKKSSATRREEENPPDAT